MNEIKYIRLQVDGHTIVEFRNGSRACSCGLERGETPNLRTVVVERIDRYTINVDGLHVRATEDQEARIRAMNMEDLARFRRIMGADGA